MLSPYIRNNRRRVLQPLRKPKINHEEKPTDIIQNALPVKLLLSDSDYSDQDSFDESGTNSDDTTTSETHMEILSQLKLAHFDYHLAFELKPRTPDVVKSMLGRYANFVSWLRTNLDDLDNCAEDEVNVAKILQSFILENHSIIVKYYKYLKDSVLLMPSTIYNYNEEILLLVNWFSVFRKSDEYKVMPVELYAVNVIIVAMRKLYSSQRASEACMSTTNTREGLKKARKWPQRGLVELNDAVNRELPWARSVSAQLRTSKNRTMYNHFMQVCSASLYTGV